MRNDDHVPKGMEGENKLLADLARAYHNFREAGIYGEDELESDNWVRYSELKLRILKIMAKAKLSPTPEGGDEAEGGGE